MKIGKNVEKHLNGNIICAIDVETTGLRAGYHEICQVAVTPLTADFRRETAINPFVCLIKPDHPKRWQKEAAMVNGLREKSAKHGVIPELAYDMFVRWFYNDLKLPSTGEYPYTKQILPLAKNWAFDKQFLTEWMGLDDERRPNFDKFIHRYARDLQPAALYLQDLAYMTRSDLPFTRFSLKALCNRLCVANPNAHDALGDCIATAECYRRLMALYMPNGVDLTIKSPEWDMDWRKERMEIEENE